MAPSIEIKKLIHLISHYPILICLLAIHLYITPLVASLLQLLRCSISFLQHFEFFQNPPPIFKKIISVYP